jgi:hypothetical protein
MARTFRTLLAIVFLAGIALLPPAAAFADPPSIPPLTPPAPSYYTCQATGAGPVCRGSVVDENVSYSTGAFCGTAEHPIELLIEQETDRLQLTRYYNTAGYLTRRFSHLESQNTILNPETGLTAPGTQIAEFIATLAVPRDFATASEQQTGAGKFYLPGAGVLLREMGREVIGPDGNDLALSGQHQIGEYFSGNHAVLAPLCAALGSPGTP